MADFKSPQFKKLRARWYKRLQESGFRDIENDRGDLVDHQSVYDFSQRIGFRTDLVDEVRDYFTWAQEMVWHGKFRCASDKRIWILHAQGKSTRDIGDTVHMHQSWITRKIKKIREHLKTQTRKKEAA